MIENEELKDRLIDIETNVDKILLYLKDDRDTSTKGLVTRLNELEKASRNLETLIRNGKWVVLTIGVPVLVYVIKMTIDGVNAINKFLL